MIREVAIMDLGILGIVMLVRAAVWEHHRVAQWLDWLSLYVLIELLFHVPMEAYVAKFLAQ